MSEKKHIDQLFKDKLKNLDVKPDHSVWDRINTGLENNNQKNVMPLWLRLSAVAAGITLLFLIGNSIFNSEDATRPTLVDTHENSEDLNEKPDVKSQIVESNDAKSINTDEIENTESRLSESVNNLSTKLSDKNNNSKSDEKTQPQTLASQQQKNVDNERIQNSSLVKKDNALSNLLTKTNRKEATLVMSTDSLSQNTDKLNSDSKSTVVDGVAVKELKDTTILETIDGSSTAKGDILLSSETEANQEENKPSLIEEAEESTTENEIVEDTPDELDKWSIVPNIAPVIFNTLSSGSSIHSQFNNNSKSGDINLSYGIAAAYTINKKLSIRAGINKVNLGYSTNDVVVYNNITSPRENQMKNIAFNETGQNLSFISVDQLAFGQIPGILSDQINGSIDQELGFVEIPVALAFKISDRKMNVNLIGGFSALFLDKNEVYSTLEGQNTLLGKATNINKLSYSANLGLGLGFKISQKFNFNIEPTFKYQLNTFTDTSGNFKPYFFGIYSGLNFKF